MDILSDPDAVGNVQISDQQAIRVAALLPAARQVMQEIEDRAMALAIAAEERWTPDLSENDVNEGGPLVFSDRQFNAFLELVKELNNVLSIQTVATYLRFPPAAVEAFATEALRGFIRAVPSSTSANGSGHVSVGKVKSTVTGADS